MPQGGETTGLERAPQLPERSAETPEGASLETPSLPSAEKEPEPVVSASLPSIASVPEAAPGMKDPIMKGVEHVLEEGLAEVYKNMDPALQLKFNTEGNRVANLLAEMVRQTKVKSREVLELISKWLKMIPHVNRFFLEQEAKIKTDKIIGLSEQGKQP
jgi:hypothetical protein